MPCYSTQPREWCDLEDSVRFCQDFFFEGGGEGSFEDSWTVDGQIKARKKRKTAVDCHLFFEHLAVFQCGEITKDVHVPLTAFNWHRLERLLCAADAIGWMRSAGCFCSTDELWNCGVSYAAVTHNQWTTTWFLHRFVRLFIVIDALSSILSVLFLLDLSPAHFYFSMSAVPKVGIHSIINEVIVFPVALVVVASCFDYFNSRGSRDDRTT